jgi:hypothetical protein
MASAMAVQVTIYLNEADQWRHRPLHMEILRYLHEENVYAAPAVHCVAGFLGRHSREDGAHGRGRRQASRSDRLRGRDEHVSGVPPTLKEMAAHRLIVRENVVLEQGELY